MAAVRVSRILHAGYILEYQDQRIVFDPLFENPFSRNCHAFPEISFDLQKLVDCHFSAVFISHFHDDHCSLDSLNILDRRTAIYIFCVHEELLEMIRGLGFQQVHSLDLEIPVVLGDFKITPHRALDADVDCLYEVQVAEKRILNVVDSWIDEAMLEKLVDQGPWDLVLWPFQSMRELEVIAPRRARPSLREIPEEHREQLLKLQPRYLVPSSCQFKQESWSWYNKAFFPVSYKSFTEQVRRLSPMIHVQRIDPGKSFLLSDDDFKETESLSWIIPHFSGELDYEYDPLLKIPPACEVSKYFAALKPEQAEFLEDFCENRIYERFKKFAPWETEYFQSQKIWNLRLHFQSGPAKDYFYKVDNKSLVELNEAVPEISWFTEISATKLFSALTTGETLTSLYLRINDCDLPADVEAHVANIDIGEDPLIRTLFTEGVLDYQKMQYARLLNLKQDSK